MKVSQKSIAEALGLSIITVSRALRNHPYLAESTKMRVLSKAQELGYTRLRAPRKERIVPRLGVLFYPSSQDGNDPLASGVRRTIFNEIERQSSALGADVIVEMPTSNTPPLLVKKRSVSAICLMGRYPQEVPALLEGIPALAVSNFIQEDTLPRLAADNFGGMYQATQHLIRLNHRHITFWGVEDPRSFLHQERARGYTIAMNDHGLTPHIRYVSPDAPELSDIPRHAACVCSCDFLAASLCSRLQAKGWTMGVDYSVVSFDNIEEYIRHYPLTSYAPDWRFMGYLAAQFLISQTFVLGRKGTVITCPGKLVVRHSVAPPHPDSTHTATP